MGRKKTITNLPSYDELMIPVLNALKQLGGSGTINEISEKVYAIASIPDDILQIPHNENINEVDYRLAWSRTYLKKYGLLDNSERGVWVLTKPELDLNSVSKDEIVKYVKDKDKEERKSKNIEETDDVVEVDEIEENWKNKLIDTILKITPNSFERLTQRILRESGFMQVEVTGKSGDGGIDGKGIIRLSGLLSFHIIFQCKRYKGSITPSQIRDFRGAMQGRADKGLFITTGTFSREAIKEATRDGAPPIDLIDGELLCDKLKELKLGVNSQQIETVDINEEWFKNL
jgi:restriction system protein